MNEIKIKNIYRIPTYELVCLYVYVYVLLGISNIRIAYISRTVD